MGFAKALLIAVLGGLLVNFLDPGLARIQSWLGISRPGQAVVTQLVSPPESYSKSAPGAPGGFGTGERSGREETPLLERYPRPGREIDSSAAAERLAVIEREREREREDRRREEQAEAERLRQQEAEDQENARREQEAQTQRDEAQRTERITAVRQRFEAEQTRIQERLEDTLRSIQEREDNYRNNYDTRLQRDLANLVDTKDKRIQAAENRRNRESEAAQRAYERDVETAGSLGNAFGGDRGGGAAAAAASLVAQRSLERRLKKFEADYQEAVKAAEEDLAEKTASLYALRKEEAERTLAGFDKERQSAQARASAQLALAEKSRDEALQQLG